MHYIQLHRAYVNDTAYGVMLWAAIRRSSPCCLNLSVLVACICLPQGHEAAQAIYRVLMLCVPSDLQVPHQERPSNTSCAMVTIMLVKAQEFPSATDLLFKMHYAGLVFTVPQIVHILNEIKTGDPTNNRALKTFLQVKLSSAVCH